MKKIPIGISDFKTIIDENYYYIDKTHFIKAVIDDGAKVILIPRPRRFGKTLNISLLRYFYEKADKDTIYLFKGLEIYNYEEIMLMQGKYPVIYLTFKDEKYSKWENCKRGLEILVSNLYREHKYLLNDNVLDEHEKKKFYNILNEEADITELSKSLGELCYYLNQYHKEKIVILIDEYDVPIQSGYINNYYEEVIEFMRNFLSGALKDNIHLEKAILTGILRVSRESIFSGLNNLKVSTILDDRYSQYFGFLEREVEDILINQNIAFELEKVKNWYNGYNFGDNIIYNPWSILNYAENYKSGYKPYWVNSSSNDLVKKLLTKGEGKLKEELECLIKGEEIVKVINEDLVMHEIDKCNENIWSFFVFSGYLKIVKKELVLGELICNLAIPNLEVKYLYKQIILSWFKESINNDKFNLMLESLIKGEIDIFEEILSQFIVKSVSYFDLEDKDESFYHALVLGMLAGLGENYFIESNKESGYGRYDVLVIPKDKKELGIVIEFKKVNKKKKENLEIAAESALKQIEEKNYKQELLKRDIENILEMGIAFQGKDLLIKSR